MPKVRSSRRVPPLKETDIDHEINLVDHSTHVHGSRAPSPVPEDGDAATDHPDLSSSESRRLLRDGAAPISRTEDESEELQNGHPPHEEASRNGAVDRPATPTVLPSTPAAEEPQSQNGNGVSRMPSSKTKTKSKGRPKSPEKEIDILYENERGGFLCGIPLFSGAALGNLDPSPWTNAAHRTSPTTIKTAQVPDPSWQWAWPSWRVNRDETIDTDQDGWEYSFMFSKKFSWHGPKWYNSFVRRRAWIRQRIKKGMGYENNDAHMLNPEYFTVGPPSAAQACSSSVGDVASNRTSVIMLEDEALEPEVHIQDIETLMQTLRKLRIDREKLDAVQSYLEYGSDDLLHLHEHMHEIMSIFVFQASRRLLLTRLMEVHDGYTHQKQRSSSNEESEKKPDPPIVRLQALEAEADEDDEPKRKLHIPPEPETEEERERVAEKAKNLAAAIKHADEEVRRLEYWSDVKGMAEGGESGGAVSDNKGWEEGWDGIDRSGGIGANKEELP